MEHITFTYDKKEQEGILVSEGDELTIKLDSGYNVVLPKKDVKITARKPVAAPKKVAVKKGNSKLPKIHILNTGGTIASKVDYSTGAVSSSFSADDIHKLFPELGELANIESELVWNVMSEMMSFGHWNILAQSVEKAIKGGAQGVIIGHGTDTLHMTAAALSFALENCPIPVLLVGSQRSSDRPSSDAASNLLCAAKFILEGTFQGVGVCMHESVDKDDCIIMHGTRTRKMHTSRRDAFRPINDTPIAQVSYPDLTVTQEQTITSSGKLAVKLFDEKLKVGLCKVHPHMFAEELSPYEKFDGLVIELTGLGHGPTQATDEFNKENAAIMQKLTALAKKIPVAGVPQTIYGRLDMNVYTPGRELLDIGILGQGCDMTPETGFVKLAWLLSNEKKKVRELYNENLRGEISKRINKKGFE